MMLGAVILVIVIIIVIAVGLSNLGPIIKNAVNTYGPKITKTEVSIDDVGVSIFSASAKIKGFYLGNPEGFKSKEAVKVGRVHVDVDEKTLAGDMIIIDKIEVISPKITYEKKRGTDNFKAILNNMSMPESKNTSTGKQPEKQGGGKKILIKNFILKGGMVNVGAFALGGKSITVPLPDIHLKDIGNSKDGASPKEAFREIFNALYRSITSYELTTAINDQIKTLGKDIQLEADGLKKQFETVGDNAAKSVEDVKNKMKGLFGK